jgi:hypothetical protein
VVPATSVKLGVYNRLHHELITRWQTAKLVAGFIRDYIYHPDYENQEFE